MASDPYIGLSRQETYDLNIEVVKKWIKSDPYFDPNKIIFQKLWKIILIVNNLFV